MQAEPDPGCQRSASVPRHGLSTVVTAKGIYRHSSDAVLSVWALCGQVKHYMPKSFHSAVKMYQRKLSTSISSLPDCSTWV